MDIDEIERIRELCRAIIDLAVRDLKRVTTCESLKETVERNRESAEAFFKTEWADDIIEAAGYNFNGRELLRAAKQSRIAFKQSKIYTPEPNK